MHIHLQQANIVIENDLGRHSQEEVERMIAEAERLREEDRQRVKEAEEDAYADDEDED